MNITLLTGLISTMLLSGIAAGQVRKECSICPEMVPIPSGTFIMGNNKKPGLFDTQHNHDYPAREVSVRQFYMARTEVTVGLWKMIMLETPKSAFECSADDCPVQNVSWLDAKEFIKKFNYRFNSNYRLPSEAEWEYACRAGGSADHYCGGFSYGEVAPNMNRVGKVAQGRTNAFGIYDMTGNVREWVEDCWHESYEGAPSDASSWESRCVKNKNNDGYGRVQRGGSFKEPSKATAKTRQGFSAEYRREDFGFRLAK